MELIHGIYFLGNKVGEDDYNHIRESVLMSLLDDSIFVYYHDIPNDIRMVRYINDHNKTENEDAMNMS